VKLYSKFSFPSGHTTAAFSMMFFLSLIIPNKYAKILFAIFAAFMGLSRVYLVQHFLIDVIAGSIVGILSTLFIYKFILVQEKIIFSKWYNFSLVEKIFKRKFNNDI
jgi:membrane-associated phospholipid phosphatase